MLKRTFDVTLYLHHEEGQHARVRAREYTEREG